MFTYPKIVPKEQKITCQRSNFSNILPELHETNLSTYPSSFGKRRNQENQKKKTPIYSFSHLHSNSLHVRDRQTHTHTYIDTHPSNFSFSLLLKVYSCLSAVSWLPLMTELEEPEETTNWVFFSFKSTPGFLNFSPF